MNQGTLYPALLRLEQAGWITSKWTASESGRRVKVYALTKAGRKQLTVEQAQWQHATGIVARFLEIEVVVKFQDSGKSTRLQGSG